MKGSQKEVEGIKSPGTEVTGECEPPCVCCLNLGSLEKQLVLLMAELSLLLSCNALIGCFSLTSELCLLNINHVVSLSS